MPRQSKPGPKLAVVAGALTQIEFMRVEFTRVGALWGCQNIFRYRVAVKSSANIHGTESHYNPLPARRVAIHPDPSGEIHRLSMNPSQAAPSKMMGVGAQ